MQSTNENIFEMDVFIKYKIKLFKIKIEINPKTNPKICPKIIANSFFATLSVA